MEPNNTSIMNGLQKLESSGMGQSHALSVQQMHAMPMSHQLIIFRQHLQQQQQQQQANSLNARLPSSGSLRAAEAAAMQNALAHSQVRADGISALSRGGQGDNQQNSPEGNNYVVLNKKSIKSQAKKLAIFECDIDGCLASFPTKFSLQRHYKKHYSKKEMKCRFCNKSFCLQQYRDEHEYTHTGEKPYSCNMCGMRFRQRGKLSHHRKNCPRRADDPAGHHLSNEQHTHQHSALASVAAARPSNLCNDASSVEEQKHSSTWAFNEHLRNSIVGMVEARAATDDSQQQLMNYLLIRRQREPTEQRQQLQQQSQQQSQSQSQFQSNQQSRNSPRQYQWRVEPVGNKTASPVPNSMSSASNSNVSLNQHNGAEQGERNSLSMVDRQEAQLGRNELDSRQEAMGDYMKRQWQDYLISRRPNLQFASNDNCESRLGPKAAPLLPLKPQQLTLAKPAQTCAKGTVISFQADRSAYFGADSMAQERVAATSEEQHGSQAYASHMMQQFQKQLQQSAEQASEDNQQQPISVSLKEMLPPHQAPQSSQSDLNENHAQQLQQQQQQQQSLPSNRFLAKRTE